MNERSNGGWVTGWGVGVCVAVVLLVLLERKSRKEGREPFQQEIRKTREKREREGKGKQMDEVAIRATRGKKRRNGGSLGVRWVLAHRRNHRYSYGNRTPYTAWCSRTSQS